MEPECAKKMVEKRGVPYEFTADSMPARFIDPLIMQGLKLDSIERGRVLCSLVVPPRLLNTGNSLHGGATAALVDLVGSAVIFTMGASTCGVSVDINVSYLDGAFIGEEIEIESKVLHAGKTRVVVSVELRNKKTRKVIAHGRHSKFLVVPSKM